MKIQDPVCGMEINPSSAFAQREHMGLTFYFCSQSCADKFDKDPHHFMTTSATTGYNAERALSRIELPISSSRSNGHLPHLEANLQALPGIADVKANISEGKLEIAYD